MNEKCLRKKSSLSSALGLHRNYIYRNVIERDVLFQWHLAYIGITSIERRTGREILVL